MSQAQVSSKRERSLAELVLVVLLVLSLMAVFIFYYFKHEREIEQTGFTQLANNFAARLVLIKAQWYMQQQPRQLWVSEHMLAENLTEQRQTAQDKRLIPINHNGWVQIPNDALACQQVWRWVMVTPLNYYQQTISAVLIKNHEEQTSNISMNCRFSTASGLHFDYNSASGIVKSAVN